MGFNSSKDLFPQRDKLREIANSFKHSGGIVNTAIQNYLPNQIIGTVINLNFQDLKKDIKLTKLYCLFLQGYIIALSQTRNMKQLLNLIWDDPKYADFKEPLRSNVCNLNNLKKSLRNGFGSKN